MTATSGKSYFDCVNIYPEDEVSIASDGALVRTAVISFVGEYWNQTLSRSHADSNTTSEKEDEKKEKEEKDGPISILFVDPSVVQAMVTFGDASIGPMHDMRRASILVFPITTHVGEGGGGDNNGGHWSLVVAVVANRRSPPPPSSSSPLQFFCIDSSGRYNERPSKGLVRLLLASSSELGWPSPLLPGKNVTTSSMNKGSPPPPPQLQYVTSFPQQETAYDCGVMVCLALQRMGQVCRGAAAAAASDAVAKLLEYGTHADWMWGDEEATRRNIFQSETRREPSSSVLLRAQELRREFVNLLKLTPFATTS